MAIKASSLRIGGLHSGLDTEAIVNAMTASTKLRITTNQRKVLKLQAQQEAYRSIIDKFSAFKDKYFDVLNGNTYLKSAATFNRHAAKISYVNNSGNLVDGAPVGVTVTTRNSATAGNYSVKVNELATQATLTSQSIDSTTSAMDISDFIGAGKDNETYTMSVTVGGVTKIISFKGADDTSNLTADTQAVIDNINESLKKAYGETNSGTGMVYVEEKDGGVKFNSTEKKAISTGTVTTLDSEIEFNIGGWETGNNSITLVINGESRTVSFQTVDDNFFAGLDGLITFDGNGNTVLSSTATAAQKAAFGVFAEVISDMYDKVRLDAYESWKTAQGAAYNETFKTTKLTDAERAVVLGLAAQGGAESDEDFKNRIDAHLDSLTGATKEAALNDLEEALLNKAFSPLQKAIFLEEVNRRNLATEQAQYKSALEAAYAEYEKAAKAGGHKLGDPDYLYYDYKASYGELSLADKQAALTAAGIAFTPVTGTNEEITAFMQDIFKNGTPTEIADLNAALKPYLEAFEETKSWIKAPVANGGLGLASINFADRNTATQWCEGGTLTSFTNAQGKLIAGYELYLDRMLDNEMFMRVGYNEERAYMNHYAEQPAQTLADFEQDYITNYFNAEELASYFNETSLKQKLESVTFSDGTKIEVNVSKDTTGGLMFGIIDGVEVTAYKTVGGVKTAVDVGAYSNPGANDFGLTPNTTTAKNITLTTKLSELGIPADTTGIILTADERAAALELDLSDIKKGTMTDAQYESAKNKAVDDYVNALPPGVKELAIADLNSALAEKAQKKGTYSFEVNGYKFTFTADTSISTMMSTVNANTKAGVTMSFSTLTNSFEFKAKEYGNSVEITFGDDPDKYDPNGLLKALGFENADFKKGSNMSLTVNGHEIETASNSYEVNGTVITVGPNAIPGQEFQIETERDVSQVMDIIKEFVKDYNDLIDYVYGFVNDKPDKDYYFLTDADREDLNLTDTQERKWEEKAMKGILHNDQTLISLMGKMRTAMYSGVPAGDGTIFGLFSIGITTSSSWQQNGKLVINEKMLMEALDKNMDMVAELFTNTSKGLMPQIDEIIKGAINTTGARYEKGVLVQKAGARTGSSVNDNSIFDQIKRLNTMIDNFEQRYQSQQDRYWKIFSALEKQMGQLNSQTDYIGQMMGNFNK